MRPMINLHHEFDPDWAGKFRNVGRPRNRSSGPWLFGPTSRVAHGLAEDLLDHPRLANTLNCESRAKTPANRGIIGRPDA
jgi:hypothetical protein